MRRISILLLILFTCFTSAASWAGSHIVYVSPPNGADDTANIQAALDTCVAYGKDCTVQLAAGTYHTRQLVEYNFQGTFKGMGPSSTTIQALYPLSVNMDLFTSPRCVPNVTTCLWPTLIIFVDGNIHVSDVKLMELAPPGTATTGWLIPGSGELTPLLDVLRFMGIHPTNVWLDRIDIEGLPDDSSTSFGFNVLQGVSYSGELPRSPTNGDFYFLSGAFTVRNSSFESMNFSLALGGFLKDNRVTIGGSQSTGNVFKNVYAGIDTETAENSSTEISYNRSEGIFNSMDVENYQTFPWVPSKPSRYFIHDNQFTPTGLYADGIFISDDPANRWINAVVYNNTVQPGPQQAAFFDGIGVYNTKGTIIWNNTITGNGTYAIDLWGSTLSAVAKNNVGGFTYGVAQIFLDPATSYDLVVCSNATDTVLDQGTNNKVIGCAADEGTAPKASTARPNLQERKPQLR